MALVGKWGKVNWEAAGNILAFSTFDKVTTRSDIDFAAKEASLAHGGEFSTDMTKADFLSMNNNDVFIVTGYNEDSNRYTVFIPYIHHINGEPSGGGTGTTLAANLILPADEPAWAEYFKIKIVDGKALITLLLRQSPRRLGGLPHLGGRRKTKSKKSRKGKSKKSKSKSRKSRK